VIDRRNAKERMRGILRDIQDGSSSKSSRKVEGGNKQPRRCARRTLSIIAVGGKEVRDLMSGSSAPDHRGTA